MYDSVIPKKEEDIYGNYTVIITNLHLPNLVKVAKKEKVVITLPFLKSNELVERLKPSNNKIFPTKVKFRCSAQIHFKTNN